jgi:predicted CXXCH cytochrome family protein
MRRALSLVLLALGATALAAPFGDGTYDSTLHGSDTRGVARVAGVEKGDCSHCHSSHGSGATAGTTTHGMLLFAANDDQLCFECHAGHGAEKVFLGQLEAETNAHAVSGAFRWPGPDPPARPGGDTGKCLNCHDPHGAADNQGLIPSMNVSREEGECLACHDLSGPAADDIQRELQRAYAHPTLTTGGRHAVDEGGDPNAFGVTARHAECEDCHNPHAARETSGTAIAPFANEPLRGVSSLAVQNGAPGTVPNFTWRDGSQNLLQGPQEYEVCFKCHSSWSNLGTGQEDLALTTNPNNPSGHPIQGQGGDPNIRPESFVNGWNASSVTRCSDCHGSADPNAPAGPHGSDQRWLLKGWHPSNPGFQTTPSDALCFQCHRRDTYANDGASNTVKGYSRFNDPADEGHTKHVDDERVPCAACHVSHGSTNRPSMIWVDGNPRINSYTQTANGGSCNASCHSSESYSINYPR